VSITYQLKIEKLALGGYGIGYHEGKTFFVARAVPGDTAEVCANYERKGSVFASVEKYIQRTAETRPSPCPAFCADDPCGGCNWLDLVYKQQLILKWQELENLFQNSLPGIDIRETIASPQEEHYRNKVFMPAGEDKEELFCGLYAQASHTVVRHNTCSLHPQIFDSIASGVLTILTRSGVTAYDEARRTGNLRHIGFRISGKHESIVLVLVTHSARLPFSNLLVKQITRDFPQIKGIIQNINRDPGNVILGNEEKILYGEPWLEDELAGLRFRIHYRSFWQINTPTTENIVSHLKNLIPPGAVIVDAYSGMGALSLPLAAQARNIICIEENPDAVGDGQHNARLNDIANVNFKIGKVEGILPSVMSSINADVGDAPCVLLIDPPRAGLAPEVVSTILKVKPASVLYLSCSPITLHRDLKLLLDGGCYRLLYLQPFDMFPHTWHVETLAVLELIQ
jgi:23S rRNA (uracil1939-C5)-methyltransferase